MQQFIMQNPWIIYALIAWTLPWKGVALWRSAKNGHKIWFVIIFLINTLAILDIVYIVFFSKKKEEMPEFNNGSRILGNGKRIV
ncbi:MAG: DUF5652 family protein [Patescibacteria group bacterium]